MLVLTRKAGERIVISGSIVVEVMEIQGNQVRIGIQAPPEVSILRQELILAKDKLVTRPGESITVAASDRCEMSKRRATR